MSVIRDKKGMNLSFGTGCNYLNHIHAIIILICCNEVSYKLNLNQCALPAQSKRSLINTAVAERQ